MKPKRIPRSRTLPATLVFRVLNEDLKDAICGSTCHCVLAKALERIFPDADRVFVRVNRIAITWKGMLHHYELTTQALKLVALNDDGSLTLMPGVSHTLRLPRMRVRPAHINLSEKRKKQIQDSNKRRAEEGRKYSRNARLNAAKSQGIHLKKLAAVQQARAQ